jgi:hypothetical protein
MQGRTPFDFTGAMSRLCHDVCERLPEFQHVRMDEVAVCFAQARAPVAHGLQAKLTPLRFPGGELVARRGRQDWAIQRVYRDGREMLYLLTFYLPRFLDHSPREKMVTVLHELFHISPEFDGDIRRFSGRYHVHSARQCEYDRQMGRLADHYFSLRPPAPLVEFLRWDFEALRNRHGAVVGLRVPTPKLVPLPRSA